jgi:hypothetical protein
MVDDQLDSDLELQMLNDAKDEIEGLRPWEILKKSVSLASGGTLPTDFASDVSVYDASNIEYKKVGQSNAYEIANMVNGYYLDLNDNKLYLTGNNSATVTLYYQASSVDLTTGSWVFPTRFHNLIPVLMAKGYYAVDAGEKSRAWDDRWEREAEKILSNLFLWDDRLKSNNYASKRYYDNPKGVNV